MRTMIRKSICWIAVLAMLVTSVPVSASAFTGDDEQSVSITVDSEQETAAGEVKETASGTTEENSSVTGEAVSDEESDNARITEETTAGETEDALAAAAEEEEDLPAAADDTANIETTIKFTYGTGKLYAKDDTGKNTDYLDGLSKTDGIYTVSVPAGDYVFEGYSDAIFLGSIELNVSGDNCDFTGDYGSQGKLLAVTLANSDSGWVYGTDFTFENVTVMSGGQTTPVPRTVVMGDNTIANRKTVLLHEGDTVMVDMVPTGDKASAYASVSASKTCNEGYTFLNISPVTKSSTSVTYPYEDTDNDGENDFDLEFGILKSGTYYIYDYYTAAGVTDPQDGTVTATFNTAAGTDYFYKVSNPLKEDAVSYGNYVKTANTEEGINEVTVTREQMYIGNSSRTKRTVISDYSNNPYDSGDIYLACNAAGFTDRPGTGNQGVIRMDTSADSSCTLYPFRNWLPIESFTSSRIIEPDFHVQVINVEGNPITVTENTDNNSGRHSFNIQAESTGTAILLVTYDALIADHAMGGAVPRFFSASRPENTGVLVVTVNGTEDVTANMYSPAVDVNTLMNASGTAAVGNSARTAGEYIDAELDHLYYITDEGASYTFTPEAGTTVTMSKGVQNGSVSFSADGVSTDENGKVTLNGIPEGKTIVKLVNGDKVSYQVLRATRTNLTVEDSDGNVYYDSATGTLNKDKKFAPGEKVTLTYSKLEHPAQKLSGIYNMNCTVVLYGDGMTVEKGGGVGVYDFNSNSSYWTATATIPASASGESYTLSALIRETGYGSYYGQHRELAYEIGKSPNFTAVQQNAWFALTDIELPLAETVNMTVRAVDEQNAEISGATIEITDANGNAIAPTDGSYTVYKGQTYHYKILAAGKDAELADFTVPTDRADYEISVTMKEAAATTWDGSAVTEVRPNEEGVYEISTGAELAWISRQVNAKGGNWNVRLMNDISLNYALWTPIGNENCKFNGTFDGNGHWITGLYCNGVSYQGLFGFAGAATIKNLGVSGEVYSTKGRAAGIVAYSNSTVVIENCVNKANVKVIMSSTDVKAYAGGIAGNLLTGSTITNCYNLGNIYSNSTVVAGICACDYTYHAIVTNCYNAGSVIGASTQSTDAIAYPHSEFYQINCYYLVGSSNGTLCKGTAKSGNELRDIASDLGEAFTYNTNGYPQLKWETEHSLIATKTAEAGCTKTGNTAYWTCTRCGKYFSDAEGTNEIGKDSWIIEATGHKLNLTGAVEATEAADGNSAYWTCSICGKYFSDAEGTTEIEKDSWVILHTGCIISASSKTGQVTGSGVYKPNEKVTLTAADISGYEFTGWYQGENCISKDPLYTFIASGDADYEAVYKVKTKTKTINTITAANLTAEYNTAKKTYAIHAAVSGGAKLTYSSNNSKIAVSSTGVITVPAKYIGKAVITIRAAETADYKAASRQITVTVNPKSTSLTSIKNKSSKKMVLKWKKNKDVTGYQLQYSLNKKFASGNKTVTVSKNKTVTKTIKSLKKGKTYYVRIRTYKKVGSTKYYSKWSGVKKVKIVK